MQIWGPRQAWAHSALSGARNRSPSSFPNSRRGHHSNFIVNSVRNRYFSRRRTEGKCLPRLPSRVAVFGVPLLAGQS
ncbi:hypothetical protein K523DRAFT_322519 [Schizophyllum commune Tattone D]|nr:hypothetical protein K523DRAFT_322519 [Schizophyllum commune Tattone D]